MMVIHYTFLTITYPDEPAHILIDYINILYLLNTQSKHPTLHNNHLNENILKFMVKMLLSRTQTITVHKVKAHANITGNKQADALAKHKYELDHRDVATPYYLPKKKVALNAKNTKQRP